MSQYTAFIVGGGVAVVVISGSIIGGIIANELNEGDNHKIKMTSSPPPPPPVRSHAGDDRAPGDLRQARQPL